MWRLQVQIDGQEVGTWELKPGAEMLMGRDPSVDLVVPERSVSRRHCRIVAAEEGLRISDLGSSNGMYLGDDLVTSTILEPGRELHLGMATLRITRADSRTGLIPIMGLQESTISGDSPAATQRSPSNQADTGAHASSDGDRDKSHSILDASRDEYKVLEKERLALLIEAGKSLSQSFELEELFGRIMDHLFQILPVNRAGIVLLEDDGSLVARHVRPERDHTELSEVCSRHIIRQVIEQDKAQIVDDASLDVGLNMAHSILASDIKAAICAPMRSNNRSIGALYADYPGKARLYSQSDLDFFGAFASLAAVALDNSRLQSQVRERERLHRDLEIAGEIQMSLLPDGNLEVVGVELDWAYWPSRHVGGDFYDCMPLDEDRVMFCLGDVSGKSVGAALFMARLVSFLRAVTPEDPDPGRVLTRTNRLLGIRPDQTMFATACCMLYTRSTGELKYASAGHWPGLILEPGASKLRETERAGIPLGVLPDVIFETKSTSVEPGSLLALYTDGIAEARNLEGEQFGTERICEQIMSLRDEPVKRMTEALLQSVGKHCQGSSHTRDDIAVLVARLGG